MGCLGYDAKMMSTCVDFLIAEHRETERQLAALEGLLVEAISHSGELGPWRDVIEQASLLYQGLARDLYRHFVLEEQALFALISPYRTMMLMEVEHDDLLALQRAFGDGLQASLTADRLEPALLGLFQAWQARLKGHILEEERGIFPLAESVLEPEEQLRSQRLLKALRLEPLGVDDEPLPVEIHRVPPTFQVRETAMFEAPAKPMRYDTLYEREHSSVQHLSLQAGMRQKLHWVGPHQCLILLSGEVALETELQSGSPESKGPHAQSPESTKDVQCLKPGMAVSLDSRLYFALHALSDAHLLVFKVWPHPHYTKAP